MVKKTNNYYLYWLIHISLLNNYRKLYSFFWLFNNNWRMYFSIIQKKLIIGYNNRELTVKQYRWFLKYNNARNYNCWTGKLEDEIIICKKYKWRKLYKTNYKGRFMYNIINKILNGKD